MPSNCGCDVRVPSGLAERNGAGTTWEVRIHQIRIVASPKVPGLPAPEGIHQDGTNFLTLHLVRRSNVEGAESTIYDLDRKPIQRCTMCEMLDSLILEDPRIMHGVTPVHPADGKSAPRHPRYPRYRLVCDPSLGYPATQIAGDRFHLSSPHREDTSRAAGLGSHEISHLFPERTGGGSARLLPTNEIVVDLHRAHAEHCSAHHRGEADELAVAGLRVPRPTCWDCCCKVATRPWRPRHAGVEVCVAEQVLEADRKGGL